MRKSTTTRRPLVGRVLSAFFTGILVLATLAGLAYLAPSVLGYERYVITGGSMDGTYDKGSIVLEKRIPVEDVAVGDVITYLPPAESGVTTLVTHRIVAEETDDAGARIFRTQGDANPDPDPWTFALTDTTQPVVEHSVPLVGHAMIALADRETRMLLVGAPAALIALLSLVELAQGVRGAAVARREKRAEAAASALTGPAASPAPTAPTASVLTGSLLPEPAPAL